LPGSGKSTLAKVLSNGSTVYSIDDYFTDSAGRYNFRFEDNHLAYKQCENNVKDAMIRADEKIFLDNVFSIEWEIEPYFKLASEYGYQVHVVTVENRHHSSNIHGVSSEQLQKMAEKYKVVLY